MHTSTMTFTVTRSPMPSCWQVYLDDGLSFELKNEIRLFVSCSSAILALAILHFKLFPHLVVPPKDPLGLILTSSRHAPVSLKIPLSVALPLSPRGFYEFLDLFTSAPSEAPRELASVFRT